MKLRKNSDQKAIYPIILKQKVSKLLRMSIATVHLRNRDDKLTYYKNGWKVFYKRDEELANFKRNKSY